VTLIKTLRLIKTKFVNQIYWRERIVLSLASEDAGLRVSILSLTHSSTHPLFSYIRKYWQTIVTTNTKRENQLSTGSHIYLSARVSVMWESRLMYLSSFVLIHHLQVAFIPCTTREKLYLLAYVYESLPIFPWSEWLPMHQWSLQ
jgi:hypothetical protein